jgi:hypothetical protein
MVNFSKLASLLAFESIIASNGVDGRKYLGDNEMIFPGFDESNIHRIPVNSNNANSLISDEPDV